MSKKVAGLPLYIWIGAAVGGLFLGLWLRSRSQAGTVAGAAVPVATTGTGNVVPIDTGSLTSALAGGGVAPASPGLDPALLSDLMSGFYSSTNTLASSGESAAVAAQANALTLAGDSQDRVLTLATNIASSAGAGSSSVGKGSSQPLVAKPAPKPPTKKVAAAPVTHYTYKTQVPVKKGQTVHYTTGKGYYAA